MKSISEFIMEKAAGAPSGLVKVNRKTRKETSQVIVGDIYDLSGDNRVEKEFSYTDIDANAYIYDKQGNKYAVKTSTTAGDAGRIAGGSHDYDVTIYNVNGTNISLHGYRAVFSTPYNADIVDDIAAGYYLEDYLAKHSSAINSKTREKVADLISAGDKDAKSYKELKNEKKKLREQEFAERYVTVYNGTVGFTIEKSKIDIYPAFYPKDDESVISDMVKSLIKKTFSIPVEKLAGLSGSIVADLHKRGVGMDKYKLAYDVKKKNFVYLELNLKKFSYDKVSKDPVEFSMAKPIQVTLSNSSEDLKSMCNDMFAMFKKQKKHDHAAWVKERAEAIYDDGRGMYPWNNDKYTKTQAKKLAEEEWKDIVNGSDPEKSNRLKFDIDLLSKAVAKINPGANVSDAKPDTTPNELPTMDDVTTSEPKVAPKKLSPREQGIANTKMDEWHAGTRKENLKLMSPAKMKTYLKICQNKGYDEQVKMLKDAAAARGITLESLHVSLSDYIKNI